MSLHGKDSCSPLNSRLLYYILFAATLTAAGIIAWQYRLVNDVAWLVYCVEQMAQGKTLYRDMVETNPPLILLLYYPWVRVAQWLHADSGHSIQAATLCMAAASALTVRRVLHASGMYGTAQRDTVTLGVLAAFLLIPSFYFATGEREQWFAILTLPYIIRYLPSLDGRRISLSLRGAIAAAAALGFCLKPHFMLVWLAVQLWYALRMRSIRACFVMENAIIVVVAMMYIVVVLHYFPGYIDRLPLLFAAYPAYENNISALILSYAAYAYAAIMFVVLFRPQKSGIFTRDALTLAWVAGAVFMEMLVQYKPWIYLSAPLFILLGVMAAVCSLDTSQPLWRKAWLGLFLAMWFFPVPASENKRYRGNEEMHRALADIIDASGSLHPALYAFGSTFWPAFPLVNDVHAVWGGRYNSLWMLHAVYRDVDHLGQVRYTPANGSAWIERRVLDELYDDFQRSAPDWLIFDISPENFAGNHFDYREWLQRDTRFKTWLTHYRLANSKSICAPDRRILCAYMIYKRD